MYSCMCVCSLCIWFHVEARETTSGVISEMPPTSFETGLLIVLEITIRPDRHDSEFWDHPVSSSTTPAFLQSSEIKLRSSCWWSKHFTNFTKWPFVFDFWENTSCIWAWPQTYYIANGELEFSASTSRCLDHRYATPYPAYEMLRSNPGLHACQACTLAIDLQPQPQMLYWFCLNFITTYILCVFLKYILLQSRLRKQAYWARC